MREVNKLIADKEFRYLVQIIQPKLSGVSETASVRLTTWKAVLFELVLLPRLLREKEQLSSVLLVASECFTMIQAIDLVSLDTSEAVAMDEAAAIFEGIQALGTNAIGTRLL
eukprot:1541196-Amphidinium_carterae.1